MLRPQHIFFALLGLIVLSLGATFVYTFAFPDASWPLKKGERVVLLPGESFEQLLTAPRDGLTKIEILFGKFTLEGDAELLVELRDQTCTSVLAQESIREQSFDSEYTYSFVFDRIQDSKDKTYCFTASFISNQPIKKDKAPRFFLDEEGQHFVHTFKNQAGERTEGPEPVAIRPSFTNDSFLTNVQELFDRISQYKASLFKGWVLMVLATLGFTLTILVTILLIREEEEE